jgi:hypothetical protein
MTKTGTGLLVIAFTILAACDKSYEPTSGQPVSRNAPAIPEIQAPMTDIRGAQWQTSGGNYTVSLVDVPSPLPVDTMHAWRIRVIDKDGKAAEGLTIEMLGGMPQHGHGLPNVPAVSVSGQPGEYMIEGITFHMPGVWQVGFALSGADGKKDEVRRDVMVN